MLNGGSNLLQLLRSSYGTFYADRAIGPVIWPFFDLLVVHQGSVEITVNEQSIFTLNEDDSLLIYPKTTFSCMSKSRETLASIHHFAFENDVQLDNPLSAHLKTLLGLHAGAKKYSLMANSQIVSDIERSLSYSETLQSSLNCQNSNRSMQLNLLNLILLQLANFKPNIKQQYMRHQYKFDLLVTKLKNNLNENYSVENMAGEVLLSISHFRSVFYELYGIQPKKYLQKIKLAKACLQLSQTNLPIKHIASELGFEEIAHFYRHFKQSMNITPVNYRNNHSVKSEFTHSI